MPRRPLRGGGSGEQPSAATAPVGRQPVYDDDPRAARPERRISPDMHTARSLIGSTLEG
ncbi:MAG: hypothetical protein OHK0024_21100 [Thalassobaculales bacterium]